LGLALGKPTVGAAKSRLMGKEVEINGKTLLMDNEEVIGEVVTTVQGKKPVYVSVGHLISLDTAVKIIRHCSKTRLPQPTLSAHNLAAKTKKELQQT
jgi:deoxyribonuclease V